jgi:phage terminase large subunit
MTQKVHVIQKVKDQLLTECDKRHRIIVGGRGKGASWSIATVLLWDGMRQPLFIPCVREVQKTIKYSVKKLLDDMIEKYQWEWFYTSTDTEIRGKNGTKFVFFGMQDYNSDNVKSLEGADRCWVAEAQSFSRRSINVLRPTIRKDGSIVWWDFNPRYETDPVYYDYIINKDKHSKVLWLSFEDNPWFTTALQQEMESDFDRDEVEARHIWLGELRFMGDKFVVPSNFVYEAMKRNIEKTYPVEVGADIAHQGGDEIVFYKRAGFKVIDIYESRKQDTPTTVNDLKAFMQHDKNMKLKIDNGDIGKAVADYMEKDGYCNINRINFGGTPVDPEHYEDCVTEMYFNLRDLMEYIDMPNDEELKNQLIQRKFDYINGRRGYEVMKIENKDSFKEHAHTKNKSPDRADALALAFYEPEDKSYGFGTLNHNYT